MSKSKKEDQFSDDEFESTKGPENTWNPTKDENGDPRTEATDEDCLIGYYVDAKHGIGEHGSSVYTIEKKDGEKVSVWGTKVINDEMEKVRLGSFIKIKWLGKQLTKAGKEKSAAKRTSKDSFHMWDVLVSKKEAPKEVNVRAEAPVSDAKPRAKADVVSDEDDDELPF